MLIVITCVGANTSLPPPPPQLSTFTNRHMLPPSSPPYAHVPQIRNPSQSSPHAGSRDLPAISAHARPGSSMSILSMLGGDAGHFSRETAISPLPNGTSTESALPPPAHYQSPVASSARSSDAEKQDHLARENAITSSNRFRAYSGSSMPPCHTLSPDTMPGRPSQPSEEPRMPYSPESIRHENAPGHTRQSSTGMVIDRPISQPVSYNPSARDNGRKFVNTADTISYKRPRQERGNTSGSYSSRVHGTAFDLLGRSSHAESMEEQSSPSQESSRLQPKPERLVGSAYPFLNKASSFPEPASRQTRADLSAEADRMIDGDQETDLNNQKSPFDAESLRRLREERLRSSAAHSHQDMNHSPADIRPRYLDSLESRTGPSDERRMSAAQAMNRSRSIDGMNQHRNSEDLSAHRQQLAIMLDLNKRGRMSPLPQAVQGAQGRTDGPSRDPSIKNEFSRMFAGIGSGVSSSGLAGSGRSTPFPSSPRQSVENEQRLPFAPPSDPVRLTDSRNSSRAEKRKTLKDNQDGLKDAEQVGERMVNGASYKPGGKRVKHHHRVKGHQ